MAAKINLRTGKIIGAERGSFAWHHEKGHALYDNSDQGIEAGVYQTDAMYCSFVFLALGQFWWAFTLPALFAVIVVLYYFAKEEMWCNKYATEKMAETAWNVLCKKKTIKVKEKE